MSTKRQFEEDMVCDFKIDLYCGKQHAKTSLWFDYSCNLTHVPILKYWKSDWHEIEIEVDSWNKWGKPSKLVRLVPASPEPSEDEESEDSEEVPDSFD